MAKIRRKRKAKAEAKAENIKRRDAKVKGEVRAPLV